MSDPENKTKKSNKFALFLILTVLIFGAGVWVGVKNPAYIWACVTAEVV